MAKKKQSSSNKTVIIVTSAVVSLLTVAVLAAIFLPPFIENCKFSELTDRILNDDTEVIVISDPVRVDKYGDLTEAEVCIYPDTDGYKELTRLLSACRDADFDHQYSAVAGIWDIAVRVEYQNGEFDILYLTETGFVRTDGQRAFSHLPCDTAAYSALYSYIVGILNT